MKNLTSIFGKKEDDYKKLYDEEFDDLDENDDDVTPYGESKEGVSFASPAAPVSLKVVRPKDHSDGPSIADHLAAGSTVVLNIESLDRAAAIRLIDFLMGAIHVLGGDMKSVTKTTLVFAPRNVGVSDLENVENADEVEEYDEGDEDIDA